MCELGCFPKFLEKDLLKVDKILVNAYRQARTKYTLIYDTCLPLMGVNLFTTEKIGFKLSLFRLTNTT